MPSRSPAWRALMLSSFALVLLWMGVLFALRARTQGGPVSDGALVQPGFAGAPGINLEASELEEPDLSRALDAFDASGIRWVRIVLSWDSIEPSRDEFAWARWDALFAALSYHPALEPVVVLDGSPQWARDSVDVDNPLAPPHERSDYGRFAAAIARRYGSRLHYYQLWHEPNISPHWGARPADPADYLGLLREASISIRSIDSDARIVLAALAPTVEAGGSNLSELTYLDALYRMGARAWFDIVAVQPYGFSSPPSAAANAEVLNFGRVALVREVMLRHGDGDSPMWATSFGWSARLPAGAASPWGSVSDEQQAAYASEAYRATALRWPWLGPLFWAAYCPSRPTADPWLGFAVCAGDGTIRPVWGVLREAAQAPSILPPGRHLPDHPALRYGDGWRSTSAAADPGPGARPLEFSFFGSGLALEVQGGPYWAFLRISIDGVPANALPEDEDGSYLVLHDPLAAARVVQVARALPIAEHRVVVEADGGWDQWPLRGVVVSAKSPGVGSLAWLAGLVALLGALAWGAVVWPFRREAARRVVAVLDRIDALPASYMWGCGILLAAALALSRWTIIDLFALMGLGCLFFVRPSVSPPLIAASLPFWQQPKNLLRWEFGLFELFLWLAVVAFSARALFRTAAGRNARRFSTDDQASSSRCRRVSLRLHEISRRLDWPMAVLLVSGLLSTVFAEAQGVAWREFRIVFLLGALLYVLVARVGDPAGKVVGPLLVGLLGGMALASMIALWQLVSGQGRIDVEGVWRVRALYGSPNNLALLLDRGVPLALALAAFGAGGSAGRRRVRIVCGVGAALLLVAALATFSKGALLLGLPVGLAVVLAGGARRAGCRWPLWVLAALAAAGTLGLALLFRTPRFTDLFNLESGTSFLRLKLWQGAWRMALDHPLLGVGPDNFLYAYRTRYVLPGAWEELNLSHPHNIVLDLFTRLGLVGVVVGAAALAAATRQAWRLFKDGDAGVWPLALGLLAGLLATLAHGLIDNSLFLPDLMGLFAIALGLLSRLRGAATD